MQPLLPLNPCIRRWILTLLVPGQAWKELDTLDSPDVLLKALGCGQDVPDEYELDFQQARKDLRAAWQQSRHTKLEMDALPVRLVSNVQRLQALAGLNEMECRVLELAVCLHAEPLLHQVAEQVGKGVGRKLSFWVAELLEVPEKEVSKVLSARGALFRSGLLDVSYLYDAFTSSGLTYRLVPASRNFVDVLFEGQVTPDTLLKDALRVPDKAQLKLSDYLPQKEQLDVLLPYLKHCLSTGKDGVNILLYGPPGTGKTQLARLLAKVCKSALYEVLSENSEGEQMSPQARFAAYRMAQCFLASEHVMLMFDEVEEVFLAGAGLGLVRSNNKSWINQVLETNSVPAVWIANDITELDAAFIRRFDMVLELPYPDKQQRAKLLKRYSRGLLDSPTLECLAELQQLSPAIISRATAVVGTVAEQLPDSSSALQMLINNTLQAQGFAVEPKAKVRAEPDMAEDYDPAFIRADADLAAIVPLLKDTPEARICLYGPPGTGKTAYGHWLAQQLAMPLKVCRASDLIAPYVGETEQNIAKAFVEAAESGSMLLIDEVDSFLRDRRSARASWESTMVNEMLTQMESYRGIFIASTNLMDGLDQAVLRRFDIKTKFDFLQAEQVWQLFELHCERLKLKGARRLQADVETMAWLTPGDFAAVARQVRFNPVSTAAELLQRLEVEMGHKEQAKQRRIGF